MVAGTKLTFERFRMERDSDEDYDDSPDQDCEGEEEEEEHGADRSGAIGKSPCAYSFNSLGLFYVISL